MLENKWIWRMFMRRILAEKKKVQARTSRSEMRDHVRSDERKENGNYPTTMGDQSMEKQRMVNTTEQLTIMSESATSVATAPSAQPKPLIGEERSGRYKILILGNSGTGKTTLGARLSRLLNIPHISLDTLHWEPNWQACPAVEFRAKVQAKLDDTAETGWVIDGSYASKLGNLVKDNATDIIWLDPPFVLYFTRICCRTFARLLGCGQPCSPGCDESWRNVFTFGEESILWWCWTHHNPYRQRQQAEVMNGVFGPKTRRLGGWGRETEDWIKDIQEMAREI